MTLRVKIEEFLFKYRGLISTDDFNYILNFINMLDVFENKSVMESLHGEHFVDCPWSEDNCLEGPDTCNCFIYRYRRENVINLIETYDKKQFINLNKI